MKKRYLKHFVLILVVMTSLFMSSCSSFMDIADEIGKAADERKAVVYSDILSSSGISDLTYVGDGKVLLKSFDEEDDETKLSIVSLLTGSEEVKATVKGEILTSAAIWLDGKPYVICEEQGGILEFYDLTLKRLDRLETGKNGALISKNGETYYYVEDEALFGCDRASGKTNLISNEWNLPVCSADQVTDDGKIKLTLYLSDIEETTAQAIIDSDTGKFVVANPDFTQIFSCEDRIYAIRAKGDPRPEELCYGNAKYNIGWKSFPLWEEHRYDYRYIEDSPYIIGERVQEVNENGEDMVYCLLGDLGGSEPKFFNITSYIEYGTIGTALYMKDIRKLLISFDGKYYVIEPDALIPTEEEIFDVRTETVKALDFSMKKQYASSRGILTVAESLREEREMADQIEKEYGITILLSNQCQPFAQAIRDYTVITTDRMDFSGYTEAQAIRKALMELKSALEIFPDGFFRQFQSSGGTEGLRILLVGSQTGKVEALGMANADRNWYNVFVNVDYQEDLSSTFCHEIWHNIESRIIKKKPEALINADWDKCNPKGFEYTGTYGNYDDCSEYVFGNSEGNEAYFFDGYSCVYAEEDRARLFEVATNPKLYNAEQVFAEKNLHRKLELMCRAIREVFVTDGWQDPIWEDYLLLGGND